jgi:hypothetical protein
MVVKCCNFITVIFSRCIHSGRQESSEVYILFVALFRKQGYFEKNLIILIQLKYVYVRRTKIKC